MCIEKCISKISEGDIITMRSGNVYKVGVATIDLSYGIKTNTIHQIVGAKSYLDHLIRLDAGSIVKIEKKK